VDTRVVDARVREHLERQPAHSKEWIDRYIRFIEFATENIVPQGQKHHILPRAVYPEFEDLQKNPWNCKPLSCADHFRAHYFLFRALPNQPLVYYVFWRMVAKALYGGDSDDRIVNELADRYQQAIKLGLRCHWEQSIVPISSEELAELVKRFAE
jgi:hypothetical protein